MKSWNLLQRLATLNRNLNSSSIKIWHRPVEFGQPQIWTKPIQPIAWDSRCQSFCDSLKRVCKLKLTGTWLANLIDVLSKAGGELKSINLDPPRVTLVLVSNTASCQNHHCKRGFHFSVLFCKWCSVTLMRSTVELPPILK